MGGRIMSSVSGGIRIFLKQDSGLETVEYAVMTAMIATVVIVALGALILAIVDIYGKVGDVL